MVCQCHKKKGRAGSAPYRGPKPPPPPRFQTRVVTLPAKGLEARSKGCGSAGKVYMSPSVPGSRKSAEKARLRNKILAAAHSSPLQDKKRKGCSKVERSSTTLASCQAGPSKQVLQTPCGNFANTCYYHACATPSFSSDEAATSSSRNSSCVPESSGGGVFQVKLESVTPNLKHGTSSMSDDELWDNGSNKENCFNGFDHTRPAHATSPVDPFAKAQQSILATMAGLAKRVCSPVNGSDRRSNGMTGPNEDVTALVRQRDRLAQDLRQSRAELLEAREELRKVKGGILTGCGLPDVRTIHLPVNIDFICNSSKYDASWIVKVNAAGISGRYSAFREMQGYSQPTGYTGWVHSGTGPGNGSCTRDLSNEPKNVQNGSDLTEL
ncbi:hypothetical protein CPC08DRAFT_720774 [Agrocybe pediades]|nr:hypothetical protein CPC08DRAFT_720774 [Agrocybe pediades]